MKGSWTVCFNGEVISTHLSDPRYEMVGELYNVAGDLHTNILDELMEMAGFVWVCSCGCRNSEEEQSCEECGRQRGSEDEEDEYRDP
jgi:hypothetical protein